MPVVHVSFPTPDPEDPFPAVLPMIGFAGLFENQDASPEEEAFDVYLHGYVASRLMKLGGTTPGEEEGFPVTIAVSLCTTFYLFSDEPHTQKQSCLRTRQCTEFYT